MNNNTSDMDILETGEDAGRQERLQQQEESAARKRELITQAQALQDSEAWRSTSEQMKNLMEQWKALGYAGPANDQLWAEFREARQRFFDRQHKHYEELDVLRKQRKEQKREIISEAKAAAQSVTNWGKTHEAFETLLERWKQAGSAGRADDDKLWAEFREIRNDFYARKKAASQKRRSEFQEKRQAKQKLIEEAQSFAQAGDYSPSAAGRMQQMNEEWKEIGFCGSEYNDALWMQFRAAQNAFWQGKKAISQAKHQAWMEKTQAAIDRRRNRISNIQRNIDTLRDRLETTGNPEKQEQISGWIAEDEAQIHEMEEEIGRMETELRE